MIDDRALPLDRRRGASEVVTTAAAFPGDRRTAIRAQAVAIDPVDRSMLPFARSIAPWLGSDAAAREAVVRLGASS